MHKVLATYFDINARQKMQDTYQFVFVLEHNKLYRCYAMSYAMLCYAMLCYAYELRKCECMNRSVCVCVCVCVYLSNVKNRRRNALKNKVFALLSLLKPTKLRRPTRNNIHLHTAYVTDIQTHACRALYMQPIEGLTNM